MNKMQKEGLISIIVPVYNAEKTLTTCVESVLSQSYANLEIILVDDGSKDQSLEICRGFARKDARVRIISQENAGPAAARNRALAVMTGEYVLFVDSDDYLPRGACRRMIDALGDAQLVIGHYYFELGNSASERGLLHGNRTLDENSFLLALLERPGSFYFSALWNKLYRAQIIRDRKIQFDPFLDWGEDFAFNMQYYHAVHQVALVDTPVYHYVKNPGGASIRTLIHLAHSCKIKMRLYGHFKGLYIEKKMYAAHRFAIWRYIYNVTLVD